MHFDEGADTGTFSGAKIGEFDEQLMYTNGKERVQRCARVQ